MRIKNLFMRIFLLVVSLYFVGIQQSKAQFNEVIRTGRPGQSIGPFTLGKGVFQNQTGFDLSNSEVKYGGSISNSADINSVLRYGLIENFEFSGAFTYGYDENTTDDFTQTSSQLKQVDLGMRTNFVEGQGLAPSIGFQYRMKIPAGYGEEYPKHIGSVITLVTGQRFGNYVGLNTNWGVVWGGNSPQPTAFYVFSFSGSLTDVWGVVAEYYGTFTDSYWYGNVDAGISYLVNNDLQFDLYGGYGGFGSNANTYFTSIGISWRLHNRE